MKLFKRMLVACLLLVGLLAMLSACAPNDPIREDIYTLGDIYQWDGAAWNALGAGGGGDVTAAANLTDNTVIRGDGGAKGVQDSGITIDDADNMVVAGSLSAGTWLGPGGLYGINVETLAGNKTLTPGTDEIHQYLDPDTSNRVITLATATASAGDRFVIRNTRSHINSQYLQIKQGGTTLDYAYCNEIKHYIFDGTYWLSAANGVGDVYSASRYAFGLGYNTKIQNYGTSFGGLAISNTYGVAVGYTSSGYTYGAAVGAYAEADSDGVAIGYTSDGVSYGTAVGYSTDTNQNRYSVAIGAYSEAERVGELARNIGEDADQENNITQGGWEGQIAGGAGATEIYTGYGTSRFTIRASSVLAFTMIITARDNTADEVARYSVNDGLIKRDGANNTTMVLCTVNTDYEDDAAWDCSVTADDANEALIVTVTGDGANITQWVAVMNGVETHY